MNESPPPFIWGGRWLIEGYRPRPDGRTAAEVRCPCGAVNHIFLWSWAGHGFKRCGGCKRKLRYRHPEVTDDE